MPQPASPPTVQGMQLTSANLAQVGANVDVPNYDRSALRHGVVHLGVGGFHRAHLATYLHELAATGDTGWGIVGAGVLAGDAHMAQVLENQDGLYTLVTRGAADSFSEVIGSIVTYVHAHPDPTELIDKIASADVQIVSLTITEGGYPIDDSTGAFVADSPNATSESAFGLLVQGLAKRREVGGSPVTVMSCDNIMSNGHAAQTSTLGVAAALAPDLVDWINESVAFPNSMVDRITPATTDNDVDWLRRTHGVADQWPVVAEPFRQWVVEDNFAGERLPLEQFADVIVTDDVEPYEFMKLRLLNAGHSCLAYLAALLDIHTVDQAMAHPSIARYVRAFLEIEAAPVLPAVAGVDVDTYIDSLIERFSNPQIGDQISRLCLDGSAKFPKFLVPTVSAQIDSGGPLSLAALALAGWCDYLNGKAQNGATIELAADPNTDVIVGLAQRSIAEPAAFVEFADVFGSRLSGSDRFVATFVDALDVLRDSGVVAAIDVAISESQGMHDRSSN